MGYKIFFGNQIGGLHKPMVITGHGVSESTVIAIYMVHACIKTVRKIEVGLYNKIGSPGIINKKKSSYLLISFSNLTILNQLLFPTYPDNDAFNSINDFFGAKGLIDRWTV